MGDRTSSIARRRQAAVPQPQEALFDTHPEVSLDFEIVRQAARQKYTRPFLILDTAIVRDKVRRFRAAMPRVRPHYAVKANPDRARAEGADPGGRGLRDRLDRRARPAARARRAGGGGVLLQPDEVARRRSPTPRPRAWSGSWSTASTRCAGSTRSSPTPSSTCASPPPTSAATGRSRASSAPASADAREIIAAAAKLRRRPRRRDLPRRLAVPQPGELARRAWRRRASAVRRHAQGRPQAAPAQHRRRLPGAPRQADPVDRGDRRGGQRGPARRSRTTCR